ncbi:Iron-sulfur assembly protein 1 [Elasticomyces elasticus]|nr:Iron-sulfur assembly protein 1 [Elasticomyces elasticus]
MAALRTTGPSVSNIFRFASQPARRCAHCMKAQRCPFSSFRPALQNAKRPLMTESAYRPHTLEPQMPPPRNAGIPETSISGGEKQRSWPPSAPWQRQDSGDKMGEAEAQKTKPTLAAQPTSDAVATPSPSPAAPRKKSKLRARKAALTVSPTAISQLRGLLDQPDPKLIRIGVKNRGCSGLAYHLEYVDKAGAFDETVEPEPGIKVLIDSKALFSIIGSEMDWQEDKLKAVYGTSLCMLAFVRLSSEAAISELARFEVYDPDVLNQSVETCHELQMCWVLLEVVLSVFFVLEFAYEAVREGSLVDMSANAIS